VDPFWGIDIVQGNSTAEISKGLAKAAESIQKTNMIEDTEWQQKQGGEYFSFAPDIRATVVFTTYQLSLNQIGKLNQTPTQNLVKMLN